MMINAAIVAAAAAVLVEGVIAGHHQHRHVHDMFRGIKRNSNDSEVCVPGCTTIYSTITGTAGLWTPTPGPSTSSVISTSSVVPTSSVISTSSTSPISKQVVTATTSTPVVVPTPQVQTCPTPGTYTFPATTVTLTETTTVCAASTTSVTSGTHTLGGVTTVVTTATTVVCPVATTTTNTAGVVTSVIKTTTYVCPSAGTYTIAPITTTVTKTVDVVIVPVVTTYCPGTYTAPAVVTTVTETDVVVVCPFGSPVTSTIVQQPTSSPAESAPAKPTSSSPASIGSGGKTWAITYTPYDSAGMCKSASAVLADIQQIKSSGFTTVRVYSTDCDTLPNVGAACQASGLKMIVGIFVGQPGCDNASPHVSEQIDSLKAWAQWGLVELVVTGNEAVFGGFCTVQQLTDLIVHVKTELASAGYTGPHSTTEVVATWIGNDMSSICSVIDIAGANAHAYFNSDVVPSAAGDFVAGQLAIVEKVCGKPGLVLESGWPNAGNGAAGPTEQAAAIASIKETCGEKVVFFSFKNDAWKAAGDCGCEKNWGCINLFSGSS